MFKNLLSLLLYSNAGYMLVLVAPSAFASFLNMYFAQIRPTDMSSNVGGYVSFLIALGMLLRCYVAGFSVEQKDYEESDEDKAIYVMIANILIVLGFVFFIGGVIQFIILMPLIAYHVFMGLRSANGNFLIGEKPRWSSISCWRREWRVVLFVSMLVVIVQIVGFRNGAPIPVVSLG
jgi:hypothetical protein